MKQQNTRAKINKIKIEKQINNWNNPKYPSTEKEIN